MRRAGGPSHFFACFPDIRCLENPQLKAFLPPTQENLETFGQDNVSKNLLRCFCSASRQKASFGGASVGQLATIVR